MNTKFDFLKSKYLDYSMIASIICAFFSVFEVTAYRGHFNFDFSFHAQSLVLCLSFIAITYAFAAKNEAAASVGIAAVALTNSILIIIDVFEMILDKDKTTYALFVHLFSSLTFLSVLPYLFGRIKRITALIASGACLAVCFALSLVSFIGGLSNNSTVFSEVLAFLSPSLAFLTVLLSRERE